MNTHLCAHTIERVNYQINEDKHVRKCTHTSSVPMKVSGKRVKLHTHLHPMGHARLEMKGCECLCAIHINTYTFTLIPPILLKDEAMHVHHTNLHF